MVLQRQSYSGQPRIIVVHEDLCSCDNLDGVDTLEKIADLGVRFLPKDHKVVCSRLKRMVAKHGEFAWVHYGLGYFTPQAAANAISHYTRGEAFYCEWYYGWASKRFASGNTQCVDRLRRQPDRGGRRAVARNRFRGEVLVTLDEAIDIAWGADRYHGVPRPTVEEALERIEHQLATCGFNWLTGQAAWDVLREAAAQPDTE